MAASDVGADGVQIGEKAPARFVVGVADGVSVLRAFAANFAYFHIVSFRKAPQFNVFLRKGKGLKLAAGGKRSYLSGTDLKADLRLG